MSNNGECSTDSNCQCYLGYYGDDCSESVATELGSEWTIRCAVVAAAFALVSFTALVQIIIVYRLRRNAKFRLGVLFLVFLGSLIATLYESIDPFGFNGVMSHVLQAILYQGIIGCIASAFILMIALWAQLYSVLNPKHLGCCSAIGIKRWLMTCAALIWVTLIACSATIETHPGAVAYWTIVAYSAFLAAAIGTVGACFLFYGLRLFRQYEEQTRSTRAASTKENSPFSAIKKMTALGVISSTLMIVTCISILISAPFSLWDYDASPQRFIFWQTLYRSYEWLFCVTIIAFFGVWSKPKKPSRGKDENVIFRDSFMLDKKKINEKQPLLAVA